MKIYQTLALGALAFEGKIRDNATKMNATKRNATEKRCNKISRERNKNSLTGVFFVNRNCPGFEKSTVLTYFLEIESF